MLQDWSKGLQSGFFHLASRVASSAGAATAKVAKAKAKRMVDLKNCIFVSEVGRTGGRVVWSVVTLYFSDALRTVCHMSCNHCAAEEKNPGVTS